MQWDAVARRHGTDKSSIGHNYLRHYERVLGDSDVRSLVEVGVHYGASLQLWADVFPKADITGIDTNDRIELGNDRITVLVGDGADTLQVLADEGARFDVVIDDASHHIADTVRTIGAAQQALADDGVLVIEDVFADAHVEPEDVPHHVHLLPDVLAALSTCGFVPFRTSRSATGVLRSGDLVIVFARRP